MGDEIHSLLPFDELHISKLRSGTEANLPAEPAGAGDVYWATDTQILYLPNAAADEWLALTPTVTAVGAQVSIDTGNDTTSGSSENAISFDNEDVDIGDCADLGTNSTRITVPEGAGGIYLATFRCDNVSGVSPNCDFVFRVNGSTDADSYNLQGTTASASNSRFSFSSYLELEADDYVEVIVDNLGANSFFVGGKRVFGMFKQ